MKAEPLKRQLMQQLMPVLAKAMVDATDQHVLNPVQFVAEQLLEVNIPTKDVAFKTPSLHAAACKLYLQPYCCMVRTSISEAWVYTSAECVQC